VLEFWNPDNSSSKSILDVLETIYLIFRKTIVQRVAIVKLGVYDGGGYCFGGVKVKVATDTAESTNVMLAGFSIWIHIGYVSIFSGMFTIVCCFAVGLGVGLGLELDLVSGW